MLHLGEESAARFVACKGWRLNSSRRFQVRQSEDTHVCFVTGRREELLIQTMSETQQHHLKWELPTGALDPMMLSCWNKQAWSAERNIRSFLLNKFIRGQNAVSEIFSCGGIQQLVTNEHLESVDVGANDMLVSREGWFLMARRLLRNGPLLWLREQRAGGRNGCLVELLNESELELTCCVLALDGQWNWKGYRGKNWRCIV